VCVCVCVCEQIQYIRQLMEEAQLKQEKTKVALVRRSRKRKRCTPLTQLLVCVNQEEEVIRARRQQSKQAVTKQHSGDRYFAEYALTGRAACKSCFSSIKPGELRWGRCKELEEYVSVWFYHFSCLKTAEGVVDCIELKEEDVLRVQMLAPVRKCTAAARKRILRSSKRRNTHCFSISASAHRFAPSFRGQVGVSHIKTEHFAP